MNDREIVVSRYVDGPRRLVFRAFTDARHLARWWGPNGFSITTSAFAFAEGADWAFVMHGPDGADYPNWIRWQRIVPMERLEFAHGSGPDDPEPFHGTITLADEGAGTRVTLRNVFATKEQRDEAVERYHAVEGGNQTLGRLAEYVAAGGEG